MPLKFINRDAVLFAVLGADVTVPAVTMLEENVETFVAGTDPSVATNSELIVVIVGWEIENVTESSFEGVLLNAGPI